MEWISVTASIVTMVAVVATGWYTRGLFLNDKRRMERKPLIIEADLIEDPNLADGWQWWTALVRNPEEVGARITQAKIAGRKQRIASNGKRSGLDDRTAPGQPELATAKRKVSLQYRIAAKGTKRHPHVPSPSDTITVRLAVYGATDHGQVTLSWHWADAATPRWRQVFFRIQ